MGSKFYKSYLEQKNIIIQWIQDNLDQLINNYLKIKSDGDNFQQKFLKNNQEMILKEKEKNILTSFKTKLENYEEIEEKDLLVYNKEELIRLIQHNKVEAIKNKSINVLDDLENNLNETMNDLQQEYIGNQKKLEELNKLMKELQESTNNYKEAIFTVKKLKVSIVEKCQIKEKTFEDVLDLDLIDEEEFKNLLKRK